MALQFAFISQAALACATVLATMALLETSRALNEDQRRSILMLSTRGRSGIEAELNQSMDRRNNNNDQHRSRSDSYGFRQARLRRRNNPAASPPTSVVQMFNDQVADERIGGSYFGSGLRGGQHGGGSRG